MNVDYPTTAYYPVDAIVLCVCCQRGKNTVGTDLFSVIENKMRACSVEKLKPDALRYSAHPQHRAIGLFNPHNPIHFGQT
jgi:hypothetical protein